MSPQTRRAGPDPDRPGPAQQTSAASQQHDQQHDNSLGPRGAATPPDTSAAAVSLLASALSYGAAGWPVLPLHSIRGGRCTCRTECGHNAGKHPITRHGVDDASTDPARITAWWRYWWWANVGVRPPAGLIVVDVDRRSGGVGALADLTRQHGPMPQTLCARTGGGGLHIWLRHSGPIRGRLCAGIDLKGCRGYLVMPPSSHASGRRYEWLTGLPIAPAPGWLGLLLGPPPPAPRPPVVSGGRRNDGLVRTVASAPEGRRNHLLNWAAYRAYERGGDPGLIAEIRAAALDIGLTADEVDRTIGSAARAVTGR